MCLVTTETPVNSLNVNITNAVNQRYPGSTILKAEQILNGANALAVTNCNFAEQQPGKIRSHFTDRPILLHAERWQSGDGQYNEAAGSTACQRRSYSDQKQTLRCGEQQVAKRQSAGTAGSRCGQRAINELNVAIANATKVHLKANVQGSNRVHHGDSVQVQVNVDRGRTDSFQGFIATVNLPSGIAPAAGRSYPARTNQHSCRSYGSG